MTIRLTGAIPHSNDNFSVAVKCKEESETHAYECESIVGVLSFDCGDGKKSAEVLFGTCCDECVARSMLLLLTECQETYPKAYGRLVELLRELNDDLQSR